MSTVKKKMGAINYLIGSLSQSKAIKRVSDEDPALARLLDRSLWFVVSAMIGFGIDQLATITLESSAFAHFLATTATGVLYMRQTRAGKKLRDLERSESLSDKKKE